MTDDLYKQTCPAQASKSLYQAVKRKILWGGEANEGALGLACFQSA